MKRKKKKQPPGQNMKVLAAQYRKDYLGKLRWYFEEWSEENLFLLLPPEEVDLLYKIHFTAPRIEPALNYSLDKKLLKEIKSDVDFWLQHYKIKIAEGITEIPLSHYSTYYLTIINYVHTIKDDKQFEGAESIREKFGKVLQEYNKTIDVASDQMSRIAQMINAFFSRPDQAYIWLTINSKINIRYKIGSYLVFEVHSEKPVIKHFEIKGIRRPAFRLGFPQVSKGVDWMKINLPSTEAFSWKNKVPVYIQSHALLRIKERLDVIKDVFINFNFFYSILGNSPFYYNNEWLIPIKLGNVVVGYFSGQLIEGAMILKTFLFLTNEGTPEAKQLAEIAGLAKMDIKFWKIDTLRNFFESDIIKNEHLRSIFEKAGCGGLFRIQVDDPEKAYSGEKKMAGALRTYLGVMDESLEVQ